MQLVLFNLCAGLISVPFQVLIKGRVVWRGGRAICLQEGWRAGGRSPLTHGVLRSGGPSLPSGSDRPPPVLDPASREWGRHMPFLQALSWSMSYWFM